MASGKTVKLFLVEGTVGGLRTAEVGNWTGHLIAARRSDLGDLLRRDESKRTGVYILWGDDQAYIGEADVIRERLKKHNLPEKDGGKDFWTDVVIITSKDANLTKAHARYLESRFIAIAKQAGRMPLTNGTSPDPISLPESDLADMESFIAEAQIVLPVLGVNLLRGPKEPLGAEASVTPSPSDSPTFEMSIPHGGTAKAREIDGEFTVLAGSAARKQWVTKELKRNARGHEEFRASLIAKGVLAEQSDRYVFTRNQVFSSPSAAAAVIAGTETRNGRLEWRVEGTAVTYGDWQTQQISAADASENAREPVLED